jgi:hypothetical protein
MDIVQYSRLDVFFFVPVTQSLTPTIAALLSLVCSKDLKGPGEVVGFSFSSEKKLKTLTDSSSTQLTSM